MAGPHFQGQGEGPGLTFSLGDREQQQLQRGRTRKERTWEEWGHTGDLALSNCDFGQFPFLPVP